MADSVRDMLPNVREITRLVRRSGVSACVILYHLKWDPDSIYQVGLGQIHKEFDVFREHWGSDFLLVGYEAHSGMYEGLKDKYPGEIHHKAIYSSETEIRLHWRRAHKDGASFYITDGDRSEIVRTTTLDIEHPDGPRGEHVLLWLDCEGSELEVLRGGERFVEGVEVINIEMTAKKFGPDWCDCVETHRWLLDHGFVRQWVHTQRDSAGQCDAIYVRPHIWREEFCCCPFTIEMMR